MSGGKPPSKRPGPRGQGPRLTSAGGKAAPKKGAASISPRREAPARSGPRKTTRKRPTSRMKGRVGRRSIWMFAGSAFFTLLIFFVAIMLYFAHDLPSISGLDTIKKQPGITMKTEDGLILASYGDVYGDYVPYEKLPKHLVDAVLATEDRRFFDHVGIDVFGIARAMFVNLREGGFVQGGSTVTQQVAKNVFLTSDRTLKRKVQEMLLAFWLEGRFSKQEILAIYLNRVYLGAGNFGIDAASRRYFDKPATKINLIEAAVLTGLLKAPSKYSPISSVELAKKRAHQVLINMEDAGYIDEAELKEAVAAFKAPKLYREDDPTGTRYFTDWLMDELPNYLGNIDQDLIVTTTLDAKLQKEAEDALDGVMDKEGAEMNASEAALVSMTPDGAIRALVGGRSYKDSQFNRAVQANRQPGSVFKLFVYLAALDAGMTPDTLVTDEPVSLTVAGKNWRPGNFDGKFRGVITMREALTQSVNTVAVQLTMAVGVNQVADMSKRLGIKGVKPNPSIALGAVDSNLLSLTTAYAHLANEGKGVQPYGITAIHSQSGKELYKRKGSGIWGVLRSSVVQQMNYMLMNVPLAGTGRGAYIGRPMAGKTGTSSDFKDAWFIGFVPQLVTGVWVGNDDNSQMKKVTGGSLPASIWRQYMTAAVKDLPVAGISASAYSSDDGLLPWQSPPQSINEFIDSRGLDRQAPAGNPQPLQQQRRNNGPELGKSFWDKLFDGDNKGKVEYDYPSSDPRR